MRKKVIMLFIAGLVMSSASIYAQDEEKGIKVNVAADVMSRYVWRGADYGASPSIQPTLSLIKGPIEIGYWGAYATNSNYTETDLYLKATVKGFSLILTDYFIPSAATSLNDTRYLVFKDNTKIDFDTLTGNPKNFMTAHAIEGALQYKGPEGFPISILIGSYIYGNDKISKDTVFTPTGLVRSMGFKNQMSTYIELGYSFNLKGQPLDVFIGMTPQSSVYSTPLYDGGMAVVNIGITGYKTIDISDKFSLPVKASLVCNPQASTMFFVFGLTL